MQRKAYALVLSSFPQKNTNNKVSTGRSTKVSQKPTGSESSGMSSVSAVKGLLQITEVELESPSCSEKLLVLCDSACSHSWISKRLADKLQVKGSPTKLTVHGINSQQLIDTETVELKLTPVHSCLLFIFSRETICSKRLENRK